ncbi:alpha/beta fold hydrolase [Chloroflexota bacterium]
MEQQIRFCTTDDSHRIAYATIGQGPPLVMTPGAWSHLELNWQRPEIRSYYEALAKYHTVIRYDKLGTGLSDRERTDFSLESEVKILEIIIDNLNLDRLALFGTSGSGPIAVSYAAKHPDRVSHLILYGSDFPRAGQQLDEAQKDNLASLISLMPTDWKMVARILSDHVLPGSSAADREQYSQMTMESITSDIASQMLSQSSQWDITSQCKSIRIPTMVMHRQKDMATSFQVGRELAATIPNSHLVSLDGIDHMPYLGDTETIIRNINEFLGVTVQSSHTMESDEPAATPPEVTGDDPAAREARSIISGMDWIALPRYHVVGNYTRYDESVRNSLKDIRQNISSAFDRPISKRENHIIWAAPGSGKTYLVQQIAASLSGKICYSELNLARCSEQDFLYGLDQLYTTDVPYLCLIDEVDAKPGEPWPYEVLLPHLDATVDKKTSFVFVLVGSSGSSITDLKEKIGSRPKGTDLLTRIPSGNEYEIPPMNVGDRLLVVLSQFKSAGNEANRDINGVEKLALYYIAMNSRLTNARQLRELAVRAVERVPTSEDRIRYDHLFDAGDPENKEFWIKSLAAADDLVNRFVTLEG